MSQQRVKFHLLSGGVREQKLGKTLWSRSVWWLLMNRNRLLTAMYGHQSSPVEGNFVP